MAEPRRDGASEAGADRPQPTADELHEPTGFNSWLKSASTDRERVMAAQKGDEPAGDKQLPLWSDVAIVGELSSQKALLKRRPEPGQTREVGAAFLQAFSGYQTGSPS